MRHLLITGKPRCGKTTLIKKLSQDIPSKTGFYTEQSLQGTRREGFVLRSFSGKHFLFASRGESLPVRFKSYTLDIEKFEEFLKEEFPRPLNKRFVVIDEIGKMEIISGVFKNTIQDILDSSKRMLATISSSNEEFFRDIKQRKDVFVLDLDQRGRRGVSRFVKEWLGCYTRDEVRFLDKSAVNALGIEESILMENAGRSVAEEVIKAYKKMRKPVIVFCGRGNNGADGLVCARHLLTKGIDTRVFFVDPGEGSPLHKIQKNILENMKRDVSITDFPEKTFIAVDAIFGVGFRGRVDDSLQGCIEKINKRSLFCLSVDIPSGLDADSGFTQKHVVKSDVTVTFLGRKTGFLDENAGKFLGKVKVVDLGVSADFLERFL